LSDLQSESPCKDAQTINTSPLRAGHAPGPIDMTWRPRHNHPCQILFKSVKEFLGGSTPKMAISYTISNDPYNSTALHHADCDMLHKGKVVVCAYVVGCTGHQRL